MKTIRRAVDILSIEIEELRHVRRQIGHGFSQSVQIMRKALDQDAKIVVTGVGKSFYIAQKISATLASTGSPSVILHPSQALHGDLGILCRNDVLLALSYSGASSEIIEILPFIKRQDVRVIAMTGEPGSALGRAADAVIRVAVRREACPFNMAPTASTTTMLAVGDALAIVLLEARGFRRQDFAKLHPGGAIGQTLLLRIADIMRSGARLASVTPNAKIKDAILAMTSARSGAVGVKTKGGKLAGIFTDGDLRRMISKPHNAIAELPIKQAMTRNPITVQADELAVSALKIFEKHAIDDLPVIDSKGRLIGMVDIQDLPRFKIL